MRDFALIMLEFARYKVRKESCVKYWNQKGLIIYLCKLTNLNENEKYLDILIHRWCSLGSIHVLLLCLWFNMHFTTELASFDQQQLFCCKECIRMKQSSDKFDYKSLIWILFINCKNIVFERPVLFASLAYLI